MRFGRHSCFSPHSHSLSSLTPVSHTWFIILIASEDIWVYYIARHNKQLFHTCGLLEGFPSYIQFSHWHSPGFIDTIQIIPSFSLGKKNPTPVDMVVTCTHLVRLFCKSHCDFNRKMALSKERQRKPEFQCQVHVKCFGEHGGFMWAIEILTLVGVHFCIKESPEIPTVPLLTASLRLIYSVSWIIDVLFLQLNWKQELYWMIFLLIFIVWKELVLFLWLF